jgi:hypothetical protein
MKREILIGLRGTHIMATPLRDIVRKEKTAESRTHFISRGHWQNKPWHAAIFAQLKPSRAESITEQDSIIRRKKMVTGYDELVSFC